MIDIGHPYVVLGQAHLQLARFYSRTRALESLITGRKNAHGLGNPDLDFEEDIRNRLVEDEPGSMGEVALREFLYQRYDILLPIATPIPGRWVTDPRDVGEFAVRTTIVGNKLIVREKDPAEILYALVWNENPVFHFPGFIRGNDARMCGHFTTMGNGREAVYRVTPAYLHPWPAEEMPV